MKRGLLIVSLLALTLLITACSSGALPLYEIATPNGKFLGTEDAQVQIKLFSDYACPYCQKLDTETVPALVEKYGDQIQIEHKDFVVHQSAIVAHIAGNCAAEQNKFWQMNELLFEHMNDWSMTDLTDYANQAGLNEEEFLTCLNDPSIVEEIKLDLEDGQALGISGTPSMTINGELYVGFRKAKDLIPIIDSYLI
jgi:protein-disulfide isomerase